MLPAESSTDTAPLLLSGPAVAAKLDITPEHLHSLRRAGKFPLPVIRLGRCVRFSATELDRWISAQCPAATVWKMLNQRRAG
jgi:predicted DNA-binding transcriptional regulator AlpA